MSEAQNTENLNTEPENTAADKKPGEAEAKPAEMPEEKKPETPVKKPAVKTGKKKLRKLKLFSRRKPKKKAEEIPEKSQVKKEAEPAAETEEKLPETPAEKLQEMTLEITPELPEKETKEEAGENPEDTKALRTVKKAPAKPVKKTVRKKTASPSRSSAKKTADSSAGKTAAKKSSSGTAGKKKRKKKLKIYNFLIMLLMFFLIIETFAFAAGLTILGNMLESKPDLTVEDLFSPESSRVFDSNGNLIADVGTQLRENVTYNELSEAVIDAFLATEDSRFFKHDGFDFARFTKSAITTVKNILTHNPSRQGGSTFTMQLVKLTYWQNDETGVTRSKDIEYKVQQIALARDLEKETNKKAIIELYLNKLNFGGTGNIRGIELASQYYYGKHAGELYLDEAAMLAGVINSPYYYDPHNFLDYATARRNTVLSLMNRHGYITDKEYKLALSVNVEDTLIDPDARRGGGSSYAYQSYIDTAIREAEQITGQDPYTVAMDIYTYMDPYVQTVMDDIQKGYYEDIVFPDELMEIGMISENNQTGEIVAIGGGRNYGRGGSMLLNHATSQFKQPGSSIKPIIDYALAFEYLGWATSHVVTDRPLVYQGTNIIIRNASGTYGGQMTLNYAVGMSLNTPAIQALQDVINTAGWQVVVNYIISLGFSKVTEENFDIGFAIGGSNFIVSCEELMAAHAVLMNGGNYIKPHTIRRIEFRSGFLEPVEPYYEKTQVLTPQSAYLAASLMYQAVNVNYYNYMQLLQRSYAVYGKTGTTDWGKDGAEYGIPEGVAKDKWMVSETSMYTTAVWVGYEKGIEGQDTYFSNEKQRLNIAGYISNHILSALNDDKNPPAVARPDGISDISHILGTFPYAYVMEGMNPSLVTYGMIKSDKVNMVTASQAAVSPLYSFSASQTGNNTIELSWTPYPDPEATEVAPNTMDISLYDSAGNMLVQASGTRLFDYSWLFGPIRYKARIMQNGEVKAEISSESENTTQTVTLLPGIDVQACGYYGYDNGSSKSNEICTTFRANDNGQPKPKPTPEPTPEPEKSQYSSLVPSPTENANLNLEMAKGWAKANDITYQEAHSNARAGTFEVTDSEGNTLEAGTDIRNYPDAVITYYFW